MLIHIDKILPELSLLQAEEYQLAQPHLIWDTLPSLNNLHAHLLDLLQHVHVSPILGQPGLDNALHICLTSPE